jgi:hypothetical protein
MGGPLNIGSILLIKFIFSFYLILYIKIKFEFVKLKYIIGYIGSSLAINILAKIFINSNKEPRFINNLRSIFKN